MKIAVKLTFLLLLFNLKCTAQKKSQKSIAIAFYNVENLFDPADDPVTFDDAFTPKGAYRYTETVYEKKLSNLAIVLSRLAVEQIPEGPGLIGLAEVENHKVLKDLVAQPQLKERKLKIVHFDSPDPRGIDVALLYHPQQFRLISAKALPILFNGRKERTRNILYVTGKVAKDTLHILVNHWPSRREGESASERKRIAAAMVNKKITDSLIRLNPYSKIIIMGDLNDNPTDKSITQTLKAVSPKDTAGNRMLFNPWWELYKQGKGTSVYKNNWMLFDQIIISRELLYPAGKSLKYARAEIFNRQFLRNPFGKTKDYPHRSFSGTRWIDGFSDHFPVIIYLIGDEG